MKDIRKGHGGYYLKSPDGRVGEVIRDGREVYEVREIIPPRVRRSFDSNARIKTLRLRKLPTRYGSEII